MKVEKVSVSQVKINPDNPRIIKDYKFSKLVKSIREFPQMLELRPIVVNNENVILGGNMRYKASVEAGLKEVFIVRADNLTEEQQQEFIIKDNVGFGEWDWDLLGNQFEYEQLEEWGLDAIKHDWDDLDYIEEAEKPQVADDRIVIILDTENSKHKSEITEKLSNWLIENYAGCEVK
jgi:ParB-like chromosome segregation protein Spo0J